MFSSFLYFAIEGRKKQDGILPTGMLLLFRRDTLLLFQGSVCYITAALQKRYDSAPCFKQKFNFLNFSAAYLYGKA